MARPKRPPRHDGVTAWTRCKWPEDQKLPKVPDPSYPEKDCLNTLQCLADAAGYEGDRCGRGVDRGDEILFITKWHDEASAKAFVNCPDYSNYLKTFGLDERQPGADGGPPCAVLDRQHTLSMTLRGLVTIFTVGFAHPVHSDATTIKNVGTLHVSPKIAYLRLGLPKIDRRAWVVEPELVGDRLVKKGVVLQTWNAAAWRTREEKLAVYRAVSQDSEARQQWKDQVEALNPVYIDEATWDFHVHKIEESSSEISVGSAEPGTEKFNERVYEGINAKWRKFESHSSD